MNNYLPMELPSLYDVSRMVTSAVTNQSCNAQMFAKPCSSFGYYRGSPYFKGEGSNMGPTVSGVGHFSQGEGTVCGKPAKPGSWQDYIPLIAVGFILILATCYVLKGAA